MTRSYLRYNQKKMDVDSPAEASISGDVEILIDSKWHSCHAKLVDQNISIELGPITVVDDAIPNGIRHIVVKKEDGQGLGVSIKGGKERRLPILVSRVIEGLAAEKSRQIFVGDAILGVSGKDLRNATHDEAVTALTESLAKSSIDLEVVHIPEVKALLERGNLQSQLGWEVKSFLNHKVLPHETIKNGKDTNTTSLFLVNLIVKDSGIIELLSPTCKRTVTLRIPNDEFFEWLTCLSDAIEKSNKDAVIKTNLSGLPLNIHKMGWSTYTEQKSFSSFETSNFFFVAQTDAELLFWDYAPFTADAWLNPQKRVRLAQSRFLSDDDLKILDNADLNRSKIQVKFADDVEVLSFSLAFPTRSVHADWMKSIVSGALEASRKLSGFSTPCKWKSTDCTLKVDLEYGFVLSDKNGRELWSKPYQTLGSSSDDGKKVLRLLFRNCPTEEELILQINPNVVVFIIHNFLSAKLQILGKSLLES